MTRHIDNTLPANHPFRVVYTTERNGYLYRVARDAHTKGWRIDSFDGWYWVAFTTNVYPTKRAAVAAFNAVAF
jgi:hypothetical protein